MPNPNQQFPNAARQPELDIARGLAVFFMIAVHVLEILGDTALAETGPGIVIGFLGGPPAAPVFMMLLGVGIVYSARATPENLARRGVALLGQGYLLNVLRGALPILIARWSGHENIPYQEILAEAATIDILQFAGLSLLFFAAWTALRLPIWWLGLVPVLAIALHLILRETIVLPAEPHLLLAAVSGLLWGSGPMTYFPFLSWIPYPVLGYLFGHRLIRTREKGKFYTLTACLGLALLAAGLLIGVMLCQVDIGFKDDYSYYHHGLVGAVTFSGFVLLWTSVLYFLRWVLPNFSSKLLNRWSRNINPMYFIHWVLLGWSALILRETPLDLVKVLVAIVALTILSDGAAVLWKQVKTGTA